MGYFSPCEVLNVHKLRRSATLALMAFEKYQHLYVCVQAILESPYLRANLLTMLLNIEHTYRLIDGGRSFPSPQWAHSTLYLLRVIRTAACGSVEVSEALHRVREQFMEIISRFRSIGAGNSDTLKDIHRLCTYFEDGLSGSEWENS